MAETTNQPQAGKGEPAVGEQHAHGEGEQPHGKDSKAVEKEMRSANQKASMPKAFDEDQG